MEQINRPYNICVINNDSEKDIFKELVISLVYGLSKKGHQVTTSINSVKGDYTNIIVASHISPNSISSQLPADSIIYNGEQFGSIWMVPAYVELLKKFKVWDYNSYNIELLKKEYQLENITYVPPGYVPTLEKIKHRPEEEKDIDVLLFGSYREGDRRHKIIQALEMRGLKAILAYGIFGVERDNYIARSKIILNVHFYQAAILEVIRLSYLLINKCFVITERSADWKLHPEYLLSMVMSEYDWIEEDVMEYINVPKRRQNVAQCGYELFKEFKQEDQLP